MQLYTLWFIILQLASSCLTLSIFAEIDVPKERDIDVEWRRQAGDPDIFTILVMGPSNGGYDSNTVRSSIAAGNVEIIDTVTSGNRGWPWTLLYDRPGYYCVCAISGRFKESSDVSILWISQNFQVDGKGVAKDVGSAPPPASPSPSPPASQPTPTPPDPPSSTTANVKPGVGSSSTTKILASASDSLSAGSSSQSRRSSSGSRLGSESSLPTDSTLSSDVAQTTRKAEPSGISAVTNPERKSPTPVIVGAVLGVVVVLILLFVLITTLRRRAKKKRDGHGRSASPFLSTSSHSTTTPPHDSRIDTSLAGNTAASQFYGIGVEKGRPINQEARPLSDTDAPPWVAYHATNVVGSRPRNSATVPSLPDYASRNPFDSSRPHSFSNVDPVDVTTPGLPPYPFHEHYSISRRDASPTPTLTDVLTDPSIPTTRFESHIAP